MHDEIIIPEPPHLYTNPAPMPTVEWVRFPDDLAFEDFQSKMEAFGIPHTPVHGQALFDAAKSGPGEGYIVEFGTYWGTGASYLGAGSKTANRERVITVDIDRGHQYSLYSSQFWERPPMALFRVQMNLIMTGVYDWVIQVRSSTWEFLNFFSGAIRVLHIDASHTYKDVRAEVMKVKSFLIQGAIVIFHDRSMEGVAQAIHEFVQDDEDFTDVKFLDTMTAVVTRL